MAATVQVNLHCYKYWDFSGAEAVQRRRRGMQRAKREEMQRTKRLQDEAAAEAKAEHEEAKEPESQGGWSWW